MIKFRRIISIFLSLLILVNMPVNFMATAPNLIVNGIKVVFSDSLGYPYIDSNNRTMIPLKAAVEAAGASVGWDATLKTAIILTSDSRVEVPIGTNILYANGQKIVNDTISVVNNGRTYLPIKAVFEAVGYKISWDAINRTVIASSDINFKAKYGELLDSGNLTRAVYGKTNLDYLKTSNEIIYKGKAYRIIEVDGGNLSGKREATVAVDIGFGNREYWGLTNEYGQLVYVFADEIILQNPTTEQVLMSGRYYSDEAKVPGTERDDLDEGHVIADSLGGVANAYNITPQNSVLNRNGDQAYMEKWIRDAQGCSNFAATIIYPNTTTQIPSHYSFTYTLKGQIINDAFDNINPDSFLTKETDVTNNENTSATLGSVKITKLDKNAEYIILKNVSSYAIDLLGWKIRSVKGDQWFTFETFKLEANATVKVGDSAVNSDVDFHWLDGRGTWNNSESDPAEIYDPNGSLIDRLNN